ncbi:MAG: UvrD-helicase domain-containing protein [Spirochaetales bacterium]|nr:UvrD-helicase domain-containing protein [Spirochaetales bacterium]
MARLISSQEDYLNQAEKQLVDAFTQFLPDDYIIYHHREVDGREFDCIVLLPEVGILVVEVKGWDRPAGLRVIDGDSVHVQYPNKIIKENPKRQARAYRFALSRFITSQTGFAPLVFDMVAYPFLDQAAFTGLSLGMISHVSLTFLKEDLLSAKALHDKIYQALCIVEKWGKPFQFNAIEMKAVRTLFEPAQPSLERQVIPDIGSEQTATEVSFQKRTKTDAALGEDQPYSELRCLPDQTSDAEIDVILSEYRQGTKYYLFTETNQLLRRIIDHFTRCLKNARLMARALDILPLDEDIEQVIESSSSAFTAFNFSAFSLETTKFSFSPIHIINGQIDCGASEQFLSAMHEKTPFNLNQYRLEHAPINQNIRVQAGAGTGKTFSMIARFAFLCHQHQYHQQSVRRAISMLTFTNEAADVMKSRLKRHFLNLYLLSGKSTHLSLLESLDSIHISTIHSYAYELLKRLGSDIGYSKNLSIVSGVFDRRTVLEDIIERHLTHMLEQNAGLLDQIDLQMYELKQLLLDIINKLYMKSVDLTHTEDLDFGNACPGYESFHAFIQAVIQDTEKEYNILLHDSDKIHLNQIIVKVRELAEYLKQNPGNMGHDYLFIDEFQDTDDTQIKTLAMLQRLAGFKYFIVGDIKQCIYRFRGATVSSFSVLEKQVEEETWLDFFLDKNYRSDNALLARYNRIFCRWAEKTTLLPYQPHRDALFSNIANSKDESSICRLVGYANGNEFIEKVAMQIRSWLLDIESAQKNGQSLQTAEKRIAILVRRNAQAEWLRKMLLPYGIDIHVKTGGALYQSAATLDFFKMVNALLNNQNSSHLAAFMVSGYVCAKIDMWRLADMESDEQCVFLTDALDRYFLDNSNQTHSFSSLVCSLRTDPVLSVIRIVIDICRPWQNEQLSTKEKARYKDNLDLLIENMLRRHTVEQLTLSKMWRFLSVAVMAGVEEQERDMESDTNPIICSTIHKAKGLEYGYVLLPFTQSDIRYAKNHGSDITVDGNRIGYSLIMNQTVIQNGYYEEHLERTERSREETRLLYVAMTRAMRQFAWMASVDKKRVLSWDYLLKAGEHHDI